MSSLARSPFAGRTGAFWLLQLLFLWAAAVSDPAAAQGNTQRIQDLINKSQQAIVKVVVDGKKPSDANRHEDGSGFFVYSDRGWSFLITAKHVIGSSDTDQSKNDDWLVDNGQPVREIELWSLNKNGKLVSLGKDVYVAPTALPGVDLALLMIKQEGYPILELADNLIEKAGVHEVFLLGFPAGKSSLTVPTPIGTGQLSGPTTYLTTASSHRGESGGPWIDVEFGPSICCGPNGEHFHQYSI